MVMETMYDLKISLLMNPSNFNIPRELLQVFELLNIGLLKSPHPKWEIKYPIPSFFNDCVLWVTERFFFLYLLKLPQSRLHRLGVRCQIPQSENKHRCKISPSWAWQRVKYQRNSQEIPKSQFDWYITLKKCPLWTSTHEKENTVPKGLDIIILVS